LSPRRAGDGTHYSYVDGNGDEFLLPSVTTILHRVFGLSPWLIPWAYKLGLEGGESPDELRDRRAKEGTAAHDFVEAYIADPNDEFEPITGFDKAFLKFVKDHPEVEFRHSEAEVYSFVHGYAGTLDIIAEIDGKPHVMDIKTKAKNIYKAYDSELVQCRAYALAAQEMGVIDESAGTAIIILKPNGLYTYDQRSVTEELWLGTLKLYNLLEAEL